MAGVCGLLVGLPTHNQAGTSKQHFWFTLGNGPPSILTYRPSSQGWAPRVLPFLFYLLFIIACLLMFVYVWVGLGFFLSLLTSSYDAMNMFFSPYKMSRYI